MHHRTEEQKERMGSYILPRFERLTLLEKMWNDPRVQLYNDREMPSESEFKDGAVFIAGPTSRHQILESNYRCEAVELIREAGFRGYIYCPEPRGLEHGADFTDRSYIHKWESSRLFAPKTLKMFWIPRKADELLGLNTNLEFGIALGMIFAHMPGARVQTFIGWPDEAERMGLPNHYAVLLAGLKRYKLLKDLCVAVAEAGKAFPNKEPASGSGFLKL